MGDDRLNTLFRRFGLQMCLWLWKKRVKIHFYLVRNNHNWYTTLFYRNIHNLIEDVSEILDTPSKRTLWFHIIPILAHHHREFCRRQLAFPQVTRHSKLQQYSLIRVLLTLPMLRLLSSKAQGSNVFWKPFKPCHVGIHWIALTECSHMSTHVPGFQTFFIFFVSICIQAKLATSGIILRVKRYCFHSKVHKLSFIDA